MQRQSKKHDVAFKQEAASSFVRTAGIKRISGLSGLVGKMSKSCHDVGISDYSDVDFCFLTTNKKEIMFLLQSPLHQTDHGVYFTVRVVMTQSMRQPK